MTYMLLLNCALKLVEEIILYYDARSKKHQMFVAVGLIQTDVFKTVVRQRQVHTRVQVSMQLH